MTSKTTIGLMAAGLALMALAPLAGAATTDDTLSRSFPYVSGVRAETAPGTGIGWYDNASPPNVCVISLLGVQAPVIGSFYYETLRVYTNLPGFVQPVTTPGLPPVAVPCPAVINPLCNVGCAIRIVPVTVGPLARTIIPQSGLVCTQQSSFITCIATSGTWTLGACRWANGSFTTRGDPNKGFLGGTGLANVLLSQDINCAGGYVNTYDFSFLLGSSGDPLDSGFDGAPASLFVPFNDGNDDTSFVVQCLSADYTTIDSSVVPPTVGTVVGADGVDYEQILDLDDVLGGTGSNWVGDLVKQFSGTGVGGNLALQGLYDLGGDNDCDFNAANVAPPTCADGLDNEPDGPADVQDPSCYGRMPVTGACYYDPNRAEVNPPIC